MNCDFNFLVATVVFAAMVIFVAQIVMGDFSSWMVAFNATVKKTKFPILFIIFGYFILISLAQNVLEYFGYSHGWMSILLAISLVQLFKFCFVLVQEKNKKG